MFVLLARRQGIFNIGTCSRTLGKRLPEVDVLTRDEFARKSRTYWTIKTGAGGAILTAAVLGFLIGLVVVSQTIYANTMENIEEYATLKALGAPKSLVARIVLTQGLALWCSRQCSGALHGDSGCRSREVADSLDLYALVGCQPSWFCQA